MYHIAIPKEGISPNERLIQLGPEKLSNLELLAIVLNIKTKSFSNLAIAQSILANLNSLSDFNSLSIQELQTIPGIGKAKSIEIKAMIELTKRIQVSSATESIRVVGSGQIALKMMAELSDKKQEHLVVIYLNTKNEVIEQRTIFIGTVRQSIAEPREIFYYACKNMATSLILVHNHPSGVVEPSQHDYLFTKKLKRSCDDIGILFIDHIIVGKTRYFSFREKTDCI